MATVQALSPTCCRRCDAPATHYVEDRFHKYAGVYCYDHAQEKAAQLTEYEKLIDSGVDRLIAQSSEDSPRG